MITALAALAGAAIMAGLVSTVSGFTRTAPPAATVRPPSRTLELVTAPFTPARRRLTLISMGVGLGLLLLTGWPIAGLAGAAAVVAIPRLASGRSAEQRIARLEAIEQWTRRLADVLGASRGLEDALMLSVRNAPKPLAEEIETLARRLRARMNTEQALRLFADDLDDPVGDLVVCALTLAASRRGPGLRAVLTNLAGMVATEVANRRHAEAERATHRTTVRWVTFFLAGFTLFVTLRDDYSQPYDTAIGQVVLTIVIAMYAASLLWIHRLANAAPVARFMARVSESSPNTSGKEEVTAR